MTLKQHTQHISNLLKINSKDSLKYGYVSSISLGCSVTDLPTICMQLVGWHLIDQQHALCKKPKDPRLPASHHLAQARHVNFMTTACYCCQFFALSWILWDTHKSLGHSSFIMLFLSFNDHNERFREMLNPMGLVR